MNNSEHTDYIIAKRAKTQSMNAMCHDLCCVIATYWTSLKKSISSVIPLPYVAANTINLAIIYFIVLDFASVS